MPQITLSNSLLALTLTFSSAFSGCVSALAASPSSAMPKSNFRIADDYKIIVPVTINGAGTFEFLLDTGSNLTTVDEKLAQQLGLRQVGEKTITGIQGALKVAVVQTDSLTMAGETVRGLDVTVMKTMSAMPGKVRGILGEDFLRGFDVLIDNRRRVIELEAGSGELAASLGGERLAIKLQGNMRGNATENRLILAGRADELGETTMALLLDSGANQVIVFGGPETLGSRAKKQSYKAQSAMQSMVEFKVSTLTVKSLRFGGKGMANVTLMAPAKTPGMDADGVMPLSMFKSVFISHSGAFVILEPTVKGVGGVGAGM